ncbi:hypothetical protein BOH66_12890 [Microbacterium aurum]|uniref:DUF2304 domain-containing protein n=1 Tax=Microbacterium aurum TaxID=36805 RepID=A0A1P8UA96_9MICO|nr:DUF2304 domain-containing protein [Microbacterium aurum]APZ35039.1 hypothetical protein BOH66_12890 [Microbacterium aurum]MBM7828989.1 hypothetical protein [Microbacterium aurum]
MDQLIIKVLLIAAFVVFAVVLLRPTGSARGQALRTIALLLLFVAAVLAVIFPTIINDVAVAVGVGRGTDLLLYGLIVVFVANALTAARRRREQDIQITRLARRVALDTVHYPDRGDERTLPDV